MKIYCVSFLGNNLHDFLRRKQEVSNLKFFDNYREAVKYAKSQAYSLRVNFSLIKLKKTGKLLSYWSRGNKIKTIKGNYLTKLTPTTTK